MNGEEIFSEFERRIMAEKGTKSVSASVLADALGLTERQFNNYRSKDLTAKQIMKLMDKYSKASEQRLIDTTVVPVVEFLELDPTGSRRGAKWELFSANDENDEEHPYFSKLKEHLQNTHGIYIFHDSRGRAVYAGKAQRLTLWTEMNNAYNRDRGEVQNIKKVSHPQRRVKYRGLGEQKRQIVKQSVALHDLAAYCSAYQVPDQLIGKFEALIVRAFANDLLNVRMENF